MNNELKLIRCTLRHWQPDDAAALARHANNYNIWRNVRDRFPYPYTLEDAEWWVDFALNEQPPVNFAIVVGGEAVGGIGLVLGHDIAARSAEIGYWLSETHWGGGIMTEAVAAFSQWAFTNFDLCRLWAGVFEHNAASARVLVNAGFKFEARLRQAVTKEGRTFDQLIYARLQA